MHGDVNKLLSNDEKATLHLHEGESQLLAYALLTSLCEDCDPQKLFDDTPKVVSFVSVRNIIYFQTIYVLHFK